MKKILFVLSVIILIPGISCNSSSDSNAGKTEKKSKSRADSLMDDIMADHGTSMAKMNKVSVALSKIQHIIDSIGKLPEPVKKSGAAYKIHLDSLFGQLRSVENRMNQWMDEFNMDSLENEPAGRIQYLESEKQKVGNLNADMISSLQKADSLLGKKVKQ